MDSPNPVGGEQAVDPAPRPTRRTFTAEYRDRILDEYLAAPHGEKGAVLRREGLYQSQMREWAQARKAAGATRNSRKALPAIATDDTAAAREVARLTRENARLTKQLTQTEAALEIMGKLHGLLESISERPGTPPRPTKP
jgi:transposase-like protein